LAENAGNPYGIVGSETADLLLVFLDLPGKGIHAQIGGFFEGAALFAYDDIVARQLDLDLHDLVLHVGRPVQPEEYLPANDVVVKSDQFVHFVLDEIDEFAVGVEMNGLNSDLHSAFFCF
jgi:hypothetical protein